MRRHQAMGRIARHRESWLRHPIPKLLGRRCGPDSSSQRTGLGNLPFTLAHSLGSVGKGSCSGLALSVVDFQCLLFARLLSRCQLRSTRLMRGPVLVTPPNRKSSHLPGIRSLRNETRVWRKRNSRGRKENQLQLSPGQLPNLNKSRK